MADCKYFIGLPGYQEEAPFDASTLVLFRKRITAEMLMETNEYLTVHKTTAEMTIPLHLSEVQARQQRLSCLRQKQKTQRREEHYPYS